MIWEFKMMYYDMDNRKDRTVKGYVSGSSWSDAMHNLEEYYDPDEFYDVRILIPGDCNEDQNIVIVKDEVLRNDKDE